MIKTYKYKLYQADHNRALHDLVNTACWVYNHCIRLHKRYYRLYKKTLNTNQLQKHIAKLRKRNKHWMKLNSQTVQDITERIEKGYKLFFNNFKKNKTKITKKGKPKKKRFNPPGFKKRIKYKSITFKQTGFKILLDNKIKIGKKLYKYWKSREGNSKIKRLVVKRDKLGDFYIFLTVEEELKSKPSKTGKIAGCDFGLKTFLTLSDGKKIESPLFFKQSAIRVKQAGRNLSSKKKGSNNRRKARQNLFRVYRKIENQRNDFQFKLANKLANEYDELYFEDLNLDGMKRLWGRKVSDLAFDKFLRVLEYKTIEKGKRLGYINRFYPSTKLCFECSCVNENLTLEDREWTCPACGAFHDRDHNAAKNILRAGTSAPERDVTAGVSRKRNVKLRCRRQESPLL